MRIISLLILILVVSFCLQRVAACTCPALEPAEALESSDAVFIGTVSEIGGLYEHHATFKVETTWKPIDADSITVYHTKDCQVGMIEGGRYLVYAKKDNGRLYTGICNRTRLLLTPEDAAADLKFLQTKHIASVPVTGLFSFYTLKIVLFIAACVLVFLLTWFLLSKFGYL